MKVCTSCNTCRFLTFLRKCTTGDVCTMIPILLLTALTGLKCHLVRYYSSRNSFSLPSTSRTRILYLLLHWPADRSVTICSGVSYLIPSAGAYFSMNPFLFQSYLKPEWELNIYATPAIITLVLLVIETAFLALALPETRSKRSSHSKPEADLKSVPKVSGAKAVPVVSRLRRLAVLKRANKLHFAFLMAFSGIITIKLVRKVH